MYYSPYLNKNSNNEAEQKNRLPNLAPTISIHHLHQIVNQLHEVYKDENIQNQKWLRTNCKLEKERNAHLQFALHSIETLCQKDRLDICENIENFNIIKEYLVGFLEKNVELTLQTFKNTANKLGRAHREILELFPQAFLEFLWKHNFDKNAKPISITDLLTGISDSTKRFITHDPLFIYIMQPSFTQLRAETEDLVRRLTKDFEEKRKLNLLKDTEFLGNVLNYIDDFEHMKKINIDYLEQMRRAINPQSNAIPCVYAITAELLNKIINKMTSYFDNPTSIDELNYKYAGKVIFGQRL